MRSRPYSFYKKELIAGLSTFATMAYVIAVNPLLLSEAGLDFAASMVATIVTTMLATLLMALLANAPIGVAPGMGVASYFVYSLVLGQGFSWQEGLSVVFVAGGLLLILTLIRWRSWLLHHIPSFLSDAIVTGVGLFLVAVGLNMVGVIQKKELIVQLNELITIELGFVVLGLALIYFLLKRKIYSAFIITILFNWALGLALGYTHWEGLISWPPAIHHTLLKLDFQIWGQPQAYRALLSIFLITLFDSMCGIKILALRAGLTDSHGKVKNPERLLVSDGLFTMVGALLGTASLALHLESLSGIEAGGRTGWTAFVVAVLFGLSLFFYPLIVSIPAFATAPVLIAIGLQMSRSLLNLPWKKQWIQSLFFVAIALCMPLTMSIYYGLVLGFWGYTLWQGFEKGPRQVPLICWIVSALFLIQALNDWVI